MFAIIRTDADGRITQLRTCGSREAAIVAAQLEKDRLPISERSRVTAVCMDDGGYTEISVLRTSKPGNERRPLQE